MPAIPSPSQLINCTDVVSCFQALYNLFFYIFLALAFLYFLYGAFQYLLSGAGIFPKEEGKKKMTNSILALIIVLTMPIILNWINPQIFRGQKLSIPKVEAVLPNYEGEDHTAPSPSLSDEQLSERKLVKVEEIINKNSLTDVMRSNPGVLVNRKIEDKIVGLGQALKNHDGIEIIITSGYTLRLQSKCHTKSGTCIDLVVLSDKCENWKKVGEILKELNGRPLFEDKIITSGGQINPKCQAVTGKDKCGIIWYQCPKTTGKHIHVPFF